jgi:TPR repeat protein
MAELCREFDMPELQQDCDDFSAIAVPFPNGLPVTSIELAPVKDNLRREPLYRQACELLGSSTPNIDAALDRLREAESMGHPDSSLLLGKTLETKGKLDESAQHYKVAAVAGDAEAIWRYGLRCDLGRGVPLDASLAVRYYRRSAGLGDSEGQCLLGICLKMGRGIPQDTRTAGAYFAQSAEQGNGHGQWPFGLCLELEHGVPRGVERAAEWYRRSARQKNAEGQWRYARCLETGSGVARNRESAMAYYRRAADQGNAEGRERYQFELTMDGDECGEHRVVVTRSLWAEGRELYLLPGDTRSSIHEGSCFMRAVSQSSNRQADLRPVHTVHCTGIKKARPHLCLDGFPLTKTRVPALSETGVSLVEDGR